LLTSIITPYRIAFTEDETLGWTIFDLFVDSIFLIDLVATFFTAYYNNEDDLITDRKQIALNYFKSWFFIDFIAIFPVSYIVTSSNYNSLARLARLPRLYRLLKMAK
jgi:potassium voltage-gated channel Eag-related subfamily H member 8